MKYVIRDRSVLTGKRNLEPLYTFSDFPVFLGCVDQPQSRDLVADMSFVIDPLTGIIQLDKLIPLEILYQEQHVDGTGQTWEKYYNDFVDYLKKRKPKRILEIGGGQGSIAKLFLKKTKGTNWVMVEPNPLCQGGARLDVVKSFFDKSFKYKEPVDTVVFSQVWEHAYDVREFIGKVAKFLDEDGQLVFAYPNLELWLKKKFTNALNFEHTVFLTDYLVDYLLAEYGFKIVDKTFYGERDIFYTAKKGKVKPFRLENKYKEYKQIFMDFVNYYQKLVDRINTEVMKFDGELYLFGAHIFSQYLINFGLKTDSVVNILDNSPLKQGRRLYGTNLWVKSPEIIKGKKRVGVILKVASYRDEILNQLKELNPGITIFE